jgi:3-methyladenine DNA glycosylase AlkC
MAEPLKNIYSEKFFEAFSEILADEITSFDKHKFSKEIFSSNWHELELKQRMTRIAQVLRKHLDPNYKKSLEQICSIIDKQRRNHSNGFNFEFMFFPEFIQLFGLEDFENSINAIEKVTQYTSCEFVVRHFLNSYPEEMSKQMFAWSGHKHHYVRRLASEGMRTKLPWAVKVNHLSTEPEKILPLLEKLIEDEAEWVRKSVANSLNDLSKDIPDLVIEFAQKWTNKSTEINKVLKHGLRTLLKQGNVEALKLFGLNADSKVELVECQIVANKVQIGEHLEFQFELKNLEENPIQIRLEYRIYFLRENGTLFPKTFKISERSLAAFEIHKNSKRHSFKPITTRKYKTGLHKVALIVNGKELVVKKFRLIK